MFYNANVLTVQMNVCCTGLLQIFASSINLHLAINTEFTPGENAPGVGQSS